METLLRLSAFELARAIKRGEVRSREVVDAHIARVESTHPTINAVVERRFERAREEAEAADAALSREGQANLPALHGVPCTIKESFRLEGMPNTSGLVARKGVIADGDATAVARLRKAGAIPIGVTNVSELCMWMETNNRVYGRTNNPYDPSRIVGGSSGGEGAVVGAGASPFGLGADIGGSIRMPAFFNGVFGHKSTGGLVPGTGQYPLSENDALRYLCTGPIARRAEDLMPLMAILAGPDGCDGGCREIALGDPSQVDLRSLTVLNVEGNGAVAVSPELAAAQARAAQALAERGARVKTLEIALLRRSRDIWSSMMAAAAEHSFADLLGNGRRVFAALEFARWFFRRSPYTLPAIGLVALERLTGIFRGRIDHFVEMGRKLKGEMAELLAGDTILLYPSYPTTAPPHYKPLFPPFNWVYTAILNVMELPATQVPLGLDREGLPLGVQVAALHGRDHVTIAAAMELERAFGGWVPPPRLTRQ